MTTATQRKAKEIKLIRNLNKSDSKLKIK
uniref:Uncharacterized protein n=1 Tax=Rhizophora mucronata TaxID=61149 RepID=A0A2P2QIL2_RHIMU